jgi:endo-alpha-1,4-polygalactosaminidase (GH114 family)
MLARVRMNFSYKGKSYKAGDEIEVNSEEERIFLGNHIFTIDFRVPSTKEVKTAVDRVVKKSRKKVVRKIVKK